MKLIIYTSFDCQLKFEDQNITLEENQHLCLESKPSFIDVYPIGKGLRPSFKIDFKNPSSIYYRIVEKEEKTLVFLLDGIFAQNFKVYNLTCESISCNIEIGKNQVSFNCKDNKKVLSIPEIITKSNCGNFYHIAYALVETEFLSYMLLYNTKNKQSKIFKGESITLSKEGFIITSSSHGYKKIIEEYIITKEGLKIKERAFSSLNLPNFDQTLPYRFLTALSLGDYKTSLSMLSPSLQENLNSQTLKSFFGNISYIFPLDEKNCFCLSDNNNTIYNFTIENGKISEISD